MDSGESGSFWSSSYFLKQIKNPAEDAETSRTGALFFSTVECTLLSLEQDLAERLLRYQTSVMETP